MSKSHRVDVVVFDIGGVVTIANEAICFNALRELGETSKNFQEMYSCDDYYRYLRGEVTPEEYHHLVVSQYFDLPITFEQLHKAFKSTTYGVHQGVVDILTHLDPNRLAVLTDTTEWQEERVAELVDMTRFSQKIFRSNEMGMVKREPECFPYVAQMLGIAPERLLLVDDSTEKVNMARASGWNVHHFKGDSVLLVKELIDLGYL